MSPAWARRARVATLALSPIALTSWLGACGLPFETNPELVANTCESDADCTDGTCAAVEGQQLCVATQADLAGVIFQLEGTSKSGTTVSHVFEKGVSIQGNAAGGTIVEVNLDVPAPFALTGRLLQPGGPFPGCTEADGSLPVKVEVRPSNELAGLDQVFTGSSTSVEGESGVRTNRFVVEVPAGTYDVYVAPQPLSAECAVIRPIPPRIFPGIVVDHDLKLEPEAEPPLRVTGSVKPGSDRDLTGFIVELVDPERGIPVSDSSPLDAAAAVDGEIPLRGGPLGDDDNGIAYYATAGRNLVLRISEPDRALVIHWSFESLDLDGNGEVTLDLKDLIANPKEFVADVIDVQKRAVPGATVTIKSISLSGSVAKNASFRVTAEADADGKIHVRLVPGTYQVLVVPPGEDGPAILEDTWEVAPDALCCGKSFPLPPRSLLTARVSTSFGGPASTVAVLASPALPGTRSYFQNVIESLELLPRQSATTTDGSGMFAMPVDSGLYDLTVRATSTTGFPWRVLPSVVIVPVEKQPAATLEDLTIPIPALFVGRASAQGIDVAGATLRAYLPLAEGDPKGTSSPVRVVAIGETIVGADGRFLLPVPPSVARIASEPSGTSSSSVVSSSAAGSFR